jgi:Mn-dependent DtxR family transcriptional regulator
MDSFVRINPLPKVTKRQTECLRYIAGFLMQHNDYPTQREIAVAMGIRSNTAYAFTEPLRKKGYIIITTKIGKRNIRLTDQAYEILNKL